MDIIRAKEILSILADGVNPITGEVMPPEDSCNQVEIVRALHTVLDAIPDSKLKPKPENAGKPWTDDEDKNLIDEFDSGKTISAIAKDHARSKGAIQSRLAAKGKIEGLFYYRSKKNE